MHHFIPQAPCLKTASGEWAADYIVRMESLHTDMPGVRGGHDRAGLVGTVWRRSSRPHAAVACVCTSGAFLTR